ARKVQSTPIKPVRTQKGCSEEQPFLCTVNCFLCGRRRAFLESRSTAALRLEHLLRAPIRIAGRSQDRAQRRKLLALNQHPNLFGVDRLALQQCSSNAVHRILVRFEDGVRYLIGLIDQPPNFEIDLPRRLLAEVAMLCNLAAQEDLLFLFAESKRTEAAHAVLADHAAGEV